MRNIPTLQYPIRLLPPTPVRYPPWNRPYPQCLRQHQHIKPALVDLTSSNLAGNIEEASGYDFPRSGVQWVFDFQGTGHLNRVNNTWELLAWGYDVSGVEYALIYETAVLANSITTGATAGLDIGSCVKGGTDSKTRAALIAGVKGLGIPQLTTFAHQIKATLTDHRRDGLLRAACGESCIEKRIGCSKK